MKFVDFVGLISSILGIVSFFLLEGKKKLKAAIFFFVFAAAFLAGGYFLNTLKKESIFEDKYEYLIGQEYRDVQSLFIDRYKGYEGWLAGEEFSNSVVFLERPSEVLLLVEKVIRMKKGKVRFKILDILAIDSIEAQYLPPSEYYSCESSVYSNGPIFPIGIIDTVSTHEETPFISVLKAYYINNQSHKIESIPPYEIECVSYYYEEGYFD